MKEYRHTRSEIETLIDEYVIGLNCKRNREIIRDKLFEGMKIHEIAEKHGLSETRVKTVIRTFKRKVVDL